jgi:hypothetical protein
VSYEKQIKDVAIRLTIASITDVLREFKTGERASEYDAGYDDGLDKAIRAVQLFLKVLEGKETNLND